MTKTHLLIDARQLIEHTPAVVFRINSHASDSRVTYERVAPTIVSARLEAQRHTRAVAASVGTTASHDFVSTPFLYLPPDSVMRDRLSAYREHSGASALKKQPCASCGRNLFIKQMQPNSIPIGSIPNSNHLKPTNPHRSHTLTNDLLLCSEAVSHSTNGILECTLCTNCYKSLQRNTRPTLALSRGFWLGAVPFTISRLNLAERILVQLDFPRIYLIKLMLKKRSASGGAYGMPSDLLMDGMKGSICSVHMPTTDVVSLLAGELRKRPRLPNPPWVLSHTLSIAFLGFGRFAPYYLRGLFTVRRRFVIEAIKTLREICPVYADVEWNEDVLDHLPDEAVPDSIVPRDTVDGDVQALADAEGVGYVRLDDEEDEPTPGAGNGADACVGVENDVMMDPDTVYSTGEFCGLLLTTH